MRSSFVRPLLASAGACVAAAVFLAPPAVAHAQDLAPPSTGPSTGPADGAPSATPSAPGATPGVPPEGKRLEKDEKKDSGRGLEWFYLDADAGFAWANMASLSSSNLGIKQTSSQGPTFGAGAGIRLFILTLGARANLDQLSSFDLWRLDAELGLHIPLGNFEPYFGLHGGYCFVGALDAGVSGSPNLSVTGGDAGLQIGFNYYLSHYFSIGLDVSGSALFLHRAPPSLPPAVAAQLSPTDLMAYQQTGDSVGLAVAPAFHLGLHL
jgi:hypothetical protein